MLNVECANSKLAMHDSQTLFVRGSRISKMAVIKANIFQLVENPNSLWTKKHLSFVYARWKSRDIIHESRLDLESLRSVVATSRLSQPDTCSTSRSTNEMAALYDYEIHLLDQLLPYHQL